MKTQIKLFFHGIAIGMVAFAAARADAATLSVCQSGCQYALPSQAYSAAVAGDTIAIQPGTYEDCIYIQKNNLTIAGVNGMPKMVNRVCGQKGILVTAAQNLTIKNLELSGATNNDNYAGIRHDAAGFNLTLDNVYIHDNDDGILSSSSGDSLVITNSRFERNGMNSSNGMAHNLYIGNSASVVFRNSSSVAAKLKGHEFKSRAARTEIYSSTIATLGGSDSRLIDVSNGGVLIVQDSVLQKSPSSDNTEMIGFGPEGLAARTHSVTLTGNKVIGDRSPTNFINFYAGAGSISIASNVFVAIQTITNAGTLSGNTVYASRTAAGYQAYPWIPSPGTSTAPAPTPEPTPAPTPAPTPIVDTLAPVVKVVSPTTGSTVRKNCIVSSTASDNVAVVSMKIYIDGVLKASSSTGSISASWNTRQVSPGSHTIRIEARDAAGNVGLGVSTVQVSR